MLNGPPDLSLSFTATSPRERDLKRGERADQQVRKK
jgi:hypothetical protein